MLEALLFGALGSSALIIGGVAGAWWRAPSRITGVLLAFASGTLISALAFELFPEAVHLGGLGTAAAGLAAGGLVFVVVNTWLDARVAAGAGDHESVPGPRSRSLAGAEADQREKLTTAAARTGGNAGLGVGLALLAAVTLDGVPENLALGVSLLAAEGGSMALLVAIFASNFPEALVGAVAMRDGGRSRRFAITMWGVTAVLLTIAVVVGNQALAGVDDRVLGFALAFAGGAVLASLADTLMPEAFERGRPWNSAATAAGFVLSFVLAGG